MTGGLAADDAIHNLLQDLAPDAVSVWSSRAAHLPAGGDLHRWLHHELGAVGRELRTTRVGVPLHASAVRAGGLGILAVGNTGCGKSTLAMLLADERSADVVSDDTIWLDAGRALGFGSPLAVRRASPFYPRVAALPYANGGDRLLVRPADLGLSAISDCLVDVIVFPTFCSGPATCVPVTAIETFARMLSSSLRPGTPADWLALAELAAKCPACRLQYFDSTSCLEVVDQALALPSSPWGNVSAVSRAELTLSGFGEGVSGMRIGGDVAVWNAATAAVVCITGWPEGAALPHGAALEQLRSMGAFVIQPGRDD